MALTKFVTAKDVDMISKHTISILFDNFLCVCVMSDERANGAIWWLNNVIRKEKREFNLIAWDEKNEDKNVKPGHKPTIITIRVVLSHAQKTLSALISCLIYAFFGSFLFSCFLVRFH